MAQQLARSGSHVYFFVILVLLSYVLSSAPRYVRQVRDIEVPGIINKPGVFRQLVSIGKAYTIDPYKRVWDGLKPDINLFNINRLKNAVVLTAP